MKQLAKPLVAAALVGLYLALYAGLIHIHRIELTDLPSFASGFVLETALLVLWCLAWSAASWLHARRDDFILHLSVTAIGGAICLLVLYLAMPWTFYLLDLPWRATYYELARVAGIMLFGLWQWRIVARRMPPLRLWAGISLTLIGLQCVQSWSQLNTVDSMARLPFEANTVLPLGSPLPVPDLNQGVNRMWSAGWD
jgi:hypothetical protein